MWKVRRKYADGEGMFSRPGHERISRLLGSFGLYGSWVFYCMTIARVAMRACPPTIAYA